MAQQEEDYTQFDAMGNGDLLPDHWQERASTRNTMPFLRRPRH